MKILINKIKRCGKGMKFFYFTGLIFYIVSYVFFLRSMLSLEGIETVIRIVLLVLFGLYFILYLIFGLTTMIQKRKGHFISLTIFVFLFSIFFSVASYYITRIYRAIDNFSQTSDTSTYTTVLLTLNSHELTSDGTIGMINNETNIENYILAKEMIEKESIKNEIVYYDDINILVSALYNEEVDAIFISKDYPVLFGNDEKYQNIINETTVVKKYSKEMKTEESTMVTTKSLTEPFTVLILGVDSEDTERLDPNAAFNGDTLMLVTFNPQTLSATMFSIPRDMYVPISCNNNRYNKVNAAAYGGTSCVIDTIENLTDIDVDYFVKVDFKAVVDLVDTMGGVDVDVEAPDYDYFIKEYGGRLCEQDSLRRFGDNLICMDTGMQHLNGEQALAYARNRHGYLESDIARNRHQQQVLEAMAKKLVQTSSFSDFEHLLDTVSKHIATNMKTSQILSFYQTIKNMIGSALAGGDFITIQKTYLTYYNITVPLGGYEVSALGYYQGSMDAIMKAMKENLGLLKVETIKTFSYDYASDYERTSEVIGKGIYTGSKLTFMPNFVGGSISTAKSFANMNDLDLNIEYVSEKNEAAGIILRQSVSAGTMVKNISGFTIYVNNPTLEKEKEDKTIDSDDSSTPKKKNNDNKSDSKDNEVTTSDEEEKNNTLDKKEDNSKEEDKETSSDEEEKSTIESKSMDTDSMEDIPGSPVSSEEE